MRMRIYCTMLLLFLPAAVLAASESGPQGTQREKESYSIGYQIGLSIKNDEIEVDLQHLVQGLSEAIEGKEPRLELNEMRRLIADLRKRAREVALKRQQELTIKNAEESERFLEKNKTREGIRTTESGLQYRVLREGDGPTPGPGESVSVHYRGTFIDGKEFDSSYAKGEPQTVQPDGVIKGWTEALQMMRTGAKWQIFVPPHLAYGRTGLGQKIPPNKLLVFEIELHAIEKKEAKESSK